MEKAINSTTRRQDNLDRIPVVSNFSNLILLVQKIALAIFFKKDHVFASAEMNERMHFVRHADLAETLLLAFVPLISNLFVYLFPSGKISCSTRALNLRQIGNAGNSCYMYASLMSLLHVNPEAFERIDIDQSKYNKAFNKWKKANKEGDDKLFLESLKQNAEFLLVQHTKTYWTEGYHQVTKEENLSSLKVKDAEKTYKEFGELKIRKALFDLRNQLTLQATTPVTSQVIHNLKLAICAVYPKKFAQWGQEDVAEFTGFMHELLGLKSAFANERIHEQMCLVNLKNQDKLSDAIVGTKIKAGAKMIPFQLGRFNDRGHKNTTPLEIPQTLDMENTNDATVSCQLHAIVVHSGGSYHGGHYYTYLFHGDDVYEFNDCNANLVKLTGRALRDAKNNWEKNGYLVYYKEANQN